MSAAGRQANLPLDHLGIGNSIHDDDGVDVRLARRPFLENDAGEVWRILGKPVNKPNMNRNRIKRAVRVRSEEMRLEEEYRTLHTV